MYKKRGNEYETNYKNIRNNINARNHRRLGGLQNGRRGDSVLTATALANVQNVPAIEQIAVGGMLATISLIASLSVAEIMVESKWWNRWAASTLEMQNTPLLFVFLAIVAFKVLMVL